MQPAHATRSRSGVRKPECLYPQRSSATLPPVDLFPDLLPINLTKLRLKSLPAETCIPKPERWMLSTFFEHESQTCLDECSKARVLLNCELPNLSGKVV